MASSPLVWLVDHGFGWQTYGVVGKPKVLLQTMTERTCVWLKDFGSCWENIGISLRLSNWLESLECGLTTMSLAWRSQM